MVICKFMLKTIILTYLALENIAKYFLDMHIPNPFDTSRMSHKEIFKWSLNPEFSYSLMIWYTKVKEPNLSNYLPIIGGIIVKSKACPRVLVIYEIQTTLFKI